jgi:hypothetical protein
MNAVPPTIVHASDEGGVPRRESPDIYAQRWAALTEVGELVAGLAGVDEGPSLTPGDDLPVRLRAVETWRRELVERGIDDLIAIMRPGLAALLAANRRGADNRPVAAALWREFAAARTAILDLLPQSGAGSSVHR